MATKNLDFWYDEQIRRYLTQLIRIFSHFQVRERTDSGTVYNRVPVTWGKPSRVVENIRRNNSENVLNAAPFISVSMSNLRYNQSRTQDPFYEDTRMTSEREWDNDTQQYTEEQGELYTIQRYMPVPYDMDIQVDIWTTNLDSKLQLLEQIAVIFNPDIEIQSNSNPFDWTNVFRVELKDVNWTNAAVPAGVDDQMEIATLQFEVPIWISPPAKVKRQTIIKRIIADIHSTESIDTLGYSDNYDDFFGTIGDDAEIVVTPGDYHLQLVGSSAVLIDQAGYNKNWANVLHYEGNVSTNSVLQINVGTDTDSEDEIVSGTVTQHPTNASILIFNLDSDTLPSDTLIDVDQIVDPRAVSPGSGLPAASIGDRYLITEDISAVGYADWAVDASEDDILQYNGTSWVVAFDASETSTVQYVTNTFTGTQYTWTGSIWRSTYEGEYLPGYWRLVL